MCKSAPFHAAVVLFTCLGLEFGTTTTRVPYSSTVSMSTGSILTTQYSLSVTLIKYPQFALYNAVSHSQSVPRTTVRVRRPILGISHIKKLSVTRYKYSMIWQKLAFSSSVVSFPPSDKFLGVTCCMTSNCQHLRVPCNVSNDSISRETLNDYAEAHQCSFNVSFFPLQQLPPLNNYCFILCHMYKMMSLLRVK